MIRLPLLLRIAMLLVASLVIPRATNATPKGVSVQKPQTDMPLSENARKHFRAGIAYVDDPSGPKWEEAYREFLAAYADTPTWRLQNNIGLCALNLERDGEAVTAYTAYLAAGGEPDLKPKDRKQIETDIATLSASLVKVELQSAPAEMTIIDERKNSKGALVINNYAVKGGKASLGIHPGRHKVTAEAPGYLSEEWVIDAPPASTHEHVFKLVRKTGLGINAVPAPATPQSTEHQPSVTSASLSGDSNHATARRRTPTSVYVAGAAAGVLAVAATITGVVTLSKQSDYKNAPDAAEADRLAKSGRTWALVTDIEIGAAALSAAAAAYLYFTAPRETQAAVNTQSAPSRTRRFATTVSSIGSQSATNPRSAQKRPDPRKAPAWQLAPAVDRNGAGFAIVGSF